MKEVPILFSAPMVMALRRRPHNPRKTQTRRVINHQPVSLPPGGYRVGDVLMGPDGQTIKPKYLPGDRLWVRESYRVDATFDAVPPSELPRELRLYFEADMQIHGGQKVPDPRLLGKLRPGMFMCRWMARTILEVTDVRAERLCAISDKDCEAEGVLCETAEPWFFHVPTPENVYAFAADEPRDSYRLLWTHLNGEASWPANPLVWAYTFRDVTP